MNKPLTAVLLDIEGTIAPLAFVHETLVPYARARLPVFLAEHWDAPDVVAARAQVAQDAGATPLERPALIAHLSDLMDRDVKATGLKALQGLIWERGYACGDLRSPLFADVAPTLQAWHARGLDVRIYSSGSVAAQRTFLKHTTAGDVTPFLRGYYDTTTGPKREAESYRRIAAAIDGDPAGIVFVSDVPAELDAAATAGLRTRLALRPGNAPAPPSQHPAVKTLAEVG